MCSELDPLSRFKRLEIGDIWFFTERDWSQECCHGNNIIGVILGFFVMHIFGARFEELCPDISGDIFD